MTVKSHGAVTNLLSSAEIGASEFVFTARCDAFLRFGGFPEKVNRAGCLDEAAKAPESAGERRLEHGFREFPFESTLP